MYAIDPRLPPPPSDDASMWRYMDFTKLISLLEEQALYFCRTDRLGDPFEGSISQATPPAIVIPSGYTGRRRFDQFDIRKIRGLTFANCWHGGDHESEAMWKLYGGEANGVAIKTKFGRFREALVDDHEVYVSTVQYRDYNREPIPWGNTLLPLLHKRVSFEHEREIRALLYPTPQRDLQESYGIYSRVDLGVLVDAIIVAPLAPQWFVELVVKVVGRYDLGDRVTRSDITDEPTFCAQAWSPALK